MGPHPKIATVERRERSRSPRDRVVARRRRDRKKECACRRSIHPSSGGTELLLSRRPLAPKPRGLAGGRKSEGTCERDAQTRAQQRAAGTKNTALFDIVNRDKANGSLCAPRLRTLVSRPSAASALARAEREPGPSARIAERNMDSAGDPFVWPLDPGSRFARPGHDRISAAPSARAGATHPRCDRAPRSRRSAAPRRIRVASLPRSFAACPRGRRRSSDWRGCRARRA